MALAWLVCGVALKRIWCYVVVFSNLDCMYMSVWFLRCSFVCFIIFGHGLLKFVSYATSGWQYWLYQEVREAVARLGQHGWEKIQVTFKVTLCWNLWNLKNSVTSSPENNGNHVVCIPRPHLTMSLVKAPLSAHKMWMCGACFSSMLGLLLLLKSAPEFWREVLVDLKLNCP